MRYKKKNYNNFTWINKDALTTERYSKKWLKSFLDWLLDSKDEECLETSGIQLQVKLYELELEDGLSLQRYRSNLDISSTNTDDKDISWLEQQMNGSDERLEKDQTYGEMILRASTPLILRCFLLNHVVGSQ